jgi:hypothetical protein
MAQSSELNDARSATQTLSPGPLDFESVGGIEKPSTMDHSMERAWPAPSEAVRQDVVRFWLTEAALPDLATAQARSQQILVVARDSSDQIAGVSTAIRAFVPLLGFDCFYYRTYVGREHRVRGLRSTGVCWEILRESYGMLNERFVRGCNPDVLGLYAEIENQSLMRVTNEAIWQCRGMNVVYLGRKRDGRHLRIWYFDGARIPK